MNYLKDIFFILASSSPRRVEFLRNLELNFKTIKSSFDEETFSADGMHPQDFVIEVSHSKIKDIAANYHNTLIAGFDTIVYNDGSILGKPANREDAQRTLKLLSGKEHKVFTGYTLMDKSRNFTLQRAVETSVQFKELKDYEIEWYTNTEEPFDKAGSYAVQGLGAFMVKNIHGSFTNVVGLPLTEFLEDLYLYKKIVDEH